MTVLCLSSTVEGEGEDGEGGRGRSEREREMPSSERRQLEPKFLPSENSPAQ